MAMGAVLLLPAAAAPAEVKMPRCFKDAYEGHCVAVTVNGQKAARIDKTTKKVLKEMGALRVDGDETLYEVPSPVRGALELHADWLPEAVAYFGARPQASIMVYPLEGQSLDTRPELSADSSVQVGGSAVVTRSDVIQGNRLPPGKYVLSVRLSGTRRGWDRQTLFLEVVE
jgi:hypothetical protein